MKKLFKLVMALILVLSVGYASTAAVQAAEVSDKAVKPYMSLDSTQLLNYDVFFGSYIGGVPNGNYTITSVKSSNPKVIRYKKEYSSSKSFSLESLKAGKSKITVKVKVGKKTYTLTKTVEIIDDKPFSYIKYDGKNIYKNNEYYIPDVYNTSGKVFEWKMKEGYKVISAKYYKDDGNSRKVQSGKKLYFAKGQETPTVTFFIETPDGKTCYYTIMWHPKEAKKK